MNFTSALLLVAAPDIALTFPEPRFLFADDKKGKAMSHLSLATQYLAGPVRWHGVESFLGEAMGWLDVASEKLKDKSLIVVLLNDSDYIREEKCVCMVAVEDSPYYLLTIFISDGVDQCTHTDAVYVIESARFASLKMDRNRLNMFIQALTAGSSLMSNWANFHAVSSMLIEQGLING